MSLPIIEASEATVFVGALYLAAGARLSESDCGTQLFAGDLAGDLAPMDSPGYVARLSPWDVDLHAFSAPAAVYDACLPETGAMASFSGLSVLGRARMVKDVIRHERFEPTTAMAFGNAPSAIRVDALDLTDFSFDRLSEVFTTDNGLREDEPVARSCGFERAADTPGPVRPEATPTPRTRGASAAHATSLVRRGGPPAGFTLRQ